MNIQKKIRLKIEGMHCASCEILIEREFKKITGVEKVKVNHAKGFAEIVCTNEPPIQKLHNAIKAHGYSVYSDSGPRANKTVRANTKQDYLEIGASFLVLIGVYFILKQLDVIPKGLAISDSMNYGLVFVIGLVAAASTCIAVTGGLLLAFAGKYNEAHPNMAPSEKFKPHLYFNAGRIVSYTALGGVIGAIGSMITVSIRLNGILMIIASVIMMILGFQMLKLFPWLKKFQPKMPKLIAHKIHDLGSNGTKGSAFFLGAATFFLPCGFTQALQLYVLSKGSFTQGALTMLAFSLGTLPALISLSAISSFAKGAFQRYFLKFAGAAVILLGLFNINNGLTLAGSTANIGSILGLTKQVTAAVDKNIQIVEGKQIVKMKVTGLEYAPSRFTIVKDIPVLWQIDGKEAQGCARVISVPKLNLVKYLSPEGITTIAFTPEEEGDISFSCTMGMTTPGAKFTVVKNANKIATEKKLQRISGQTACDPNVANCLQAQKLTAEISRERGFYPQSFTIKKGIPVDLLLTDSVPLGGCMSVLVIPDYDIALPLKLGENKLAFTPTKTGKVYATCSMGRKLMEFAVTD